MLSIVYSSFSHLPRSINLHRFEQKGKLGGKSFFILKLTNFGIYKGIEEISLEFNKLALRYYNNERKLKLLFSNPAKGSACKRWLLYLRWMVRPNDGIDLGLWKEILPSELIIPVDIHVFRVSYALGLTERKSINWKTAEDITAKLKIFDPVDPLKYDFALMRMDKYGIEEIIKRGCRIKN